jgi:nicotinamidase-related amidase
VRSGGGLRSCSIADAVLLGYQEMPLIDRSDSLLIVVDTQPGFFDHPKMTDEERATAAVTVERIAWLAGLASLIDVPVVVVEEGADRNGPTDPRVLERLGPDSAVHSKSTFSLTGCQAAVDAVRATGRSTVVVVGFETDVCVAQSAVGLHDLGLRAVVLDDATYSTGGQHRRGLARMTHAGVEYNHFKGLIFEWLPTVSYARETFGVAVERFGPFPLR